MPSRVTDAGNFSNAVMLVMAACWAAKVLRALRSSRRAKEMLKRGAEIADTTRRAYT
jgi:hypothetical protein